MQCLNPVDFETRAFGFPFFRVTDLSEDVLRQELAALGDLRPMAADAKAPAENVAQSHALQRLGFRKVSMQVTFERDLNGAVAPDADVRISDRLELADDILYRHSRNFTQDRFSLDPFLPEEGRLRLYLQWFRNSLGGMKQTASLGPNVCTFLHVGNGVKIDLLSILEPRKGIGLRLVSAVVAAAREKGAEWVRVVTECENPAACALYQKAGFGKPAYTSVFHFVRT
jgi:GNAT superfamily N-acetyltransferase